MEKIESNIKPIGVIGVGLWGTALAQVLARSGHKVLVWAKEADVVSEINEKHKNSLYTPTTTLHENITATSELNNIPTKCNHILICASSDANTEIAANLSQSLTSKHTLIIASKGFRHSDGALLTQVWKEAVSELKNIAVLAGPSFASEMLMEKSSSLVISSEHKDVAEDIGKLFNLPYLQIFYNYDIIGSQVGGAIRDVITIACAICDGLGLGNEAHSSLIARGLEEAAQYAQSCGGKRQTIYGLSGLGDILLSASSTLSKHYRFGLDIAKGVNIQTAIEREGGNVSGIQVARIITEQSVSRGVEMPIVAATDGIIHNDMTTKQFKEIIFSKSHVPEFTA